MAACRVTSRRWRSGSPPATSLDRSRGRFPERGCLALVRCARFFCFLFGRLLVGLHLLLFELLRPGDLLLDPVRDRGRGDGDEGVLASVEVLAQVLEIRPAQPGGSVAGDGTQPGA